MPQGQGHIANTTFAPEGAWQSDVSASKKCLGYDAFGALLPGRNYSSGSYRYLFQGQEHDDEINGAVGTSYAFEYRIHDPRVGRFLSIDPLAPKYPQWSTYAFSGNQVVSSKELEGLEPKEDLNNQPTPSSSTLGQLGTATGIQSSPRTLVTTDAGHGDRNSKNTVVDPGAVDGTHYEKDYALMVETEVNNWLRSFGIPSDRTRSGDTDVRPEGPINWRWEAANKTKSSVFVSIHLNSGTSCDAFAVYQQGKANECDSKELGKLVMGRLGTMFTVPENNVRPVNGYTRFTTLGLLNNFSGQSAILLELGGIGSAETRVLIRTRSSDIGREIATAIYQHMYGTMPPKR